MFTEVQPLNLVLQKCVVSLCLADVPVYSNKSHTSLEKVFHFKTAFHLKKVEKMISDAQTVILSLPPTLCLRGKKFVIFL